MAERRLAAAFQQIRNLLGAQQTSGVTDRQLLDRFVREREEAAFSALVQRHGALVWGVCLRMLRDVHAAEDAFQATFLVLARRAGAVRWHDSVSGWLYAVAQRVARRARVTDGRRQAQERRATDMPGPRSSAAGLDPIDATATGNPVDAAMRQELRSVVDEELQRLPEKYRLALVLCYLEGKTHQEAAQELGWPVGSMSRHVNRGRELLQRRLSQRGVALSVAAAGGVLSETATAAVPAALAERTVRAALLFAAGQAAAPGVMASEAAVLANGVLKAMLMTRLKIVAVVALAVSLTGLGVGVAWSAAGAVRRGEAPGERTGPEEGTTAVVAAEQPRKGAADGSDPRADAKAGITPDELYGDQGGEKVAPANARLPNLVMRARREDTFLKLSNPRPGETSGSGPKRKALLVDFEVLSRGKLDGGTLILHTDDGGRAEVALSSITNRDHGTIELVGARQFGSLKIPRNATFPENVEMYVTRVDDRYDPPLKVMVSNSTVMGKMKSRTGARDWTAAEIKRYTQPPPSYKNPNAYPSIGEDVPTLPPAGGQFRFVDPNGRLLGLDYHIGEWEKRKVVGGLTPVYSLDQPRKHTARSVARKGYAVAGAEVNMDKYVCGIRLLFRRVKPDGTFDAKDAYAGEWIGVAPTGPPTKLVNDGRRVLGIHIQQGAIVDRFALVVEAEGK